MEELENNVASGSKREERKLVHMKVTWLGLIAYIRNVKS